MVRKALNPITLATIIVIMYMTMPIMSIFISAYITTYAYMLLAVILISFIMFTGGLKRLSTILYILLPLIIYVACTYTTRGDSVVLWGYQSMLFLLPVIIGYYFLYYRPESINILTAVMIIAVFITVITTIIGLIQFPMAARILATAEAVDDPNFSTYCWHNIGGYEFIYIAVLLYPILILSYKLKRINTFTFIISLILMFTLIILSEYTTALILILLTSVLYFAGRKLSAKQLLILGAAFFIFLFFFWSFVSDFLLWLAGLFDSDALTERLTALAGGITGLENFEDNRLNLYGLSLEGFISSPVFGGMLGVKTANGGHSFILDSLANYGVISGIALIFAYRNIYRFFFKPFRNKQGYGFVLWAFAQSIILSLVNTGMWLTVLTFLIPAILTAIYNSNSEGEYEDSLDS